MADNTTTAPVVDKVKLQANAKTRREALYKLDPSGVIGQTLAVLTMSGLNASLKHIRVKIGGEWIDTTNMGTPLLSEGQIANKEGTPSVYSDLEIRATMQHDFSQIPPVRNPPASFTLDIGPSGDVQVISGDASINAYEIDGPLDGTMTMAEVEFKFSGIVDLS
jgi:hypothetical protein